MRFSVATMAVAALSAGQALASNHRHMHRHVRKSPTPEDLDPLVKRDIDIASIASTLTKLGFVSTGKNDLTSNGNAWLGNDGQWTNEFHNNATDDVILVIWGSASSWVNVVQPLVTVPLASGEKRNVSFASGASGAWSAIYPETSLVLGQVSETWGEYTFGDYGVVDVSREVNMDGHSMSIQTPECTSDMTTCVFQCKDGATSCWLEYELVNCDNGSQAGATYGLYDGSPSGGCGGMGDAAHLTTVLGD